MNVTEMLFELQDKENAAFQAKLTPTLPPVAFIGVRVPQCRALAKKLFKENAYGDFLADLPHKLFDENMLHGLIISEIKDYETCIKELERFLPYVDNWAVCDIMSPKIFKKHRGELIGKVYEWVNSPQTYTCRFGLGTLLGHYLDDDFKPEYLRLASSIKSDEYYVNMMIAWFFATALSKQWDAALPVLKSGVLPKFVHNKTIQKARESYRISDERKQLLNELKIR